MRLLGLFRRSEPSADLLDRLEQLERAVKALQLDWEQTYDKVHRLMARIARRQAILEAAETREDAPGSPIAGPAGVDRITQEVLARRRSSGLRG